MGEKKSNGFKHYPERDIMFHYLVWCCCMYHYTTAAPIVQTDHASYVSKTHTSVLGHDDDTLSIILPHLNIPQRLASVLQAFGDMRLMLDLATRDAFGQVVPELSLVFRPKGEDEEAVDVDFAADNEA